MLSFFVCRNDGVSLVMSFVLTCVMVMMGPRLVYAQNQMHWSANLDVSNRYLFRSQSLGNDAPTVQIEGVGKIVAGQFFGGSLRGVRGPVEADTVTRVFGGQKFRLIGFDFNVLAEYLYWHHSDYKPMTLVGLLIQKDWVRAQMKLDFADGGDQHLEVNMRILKKKQVMLALNCVDSKTPQKDVMTGISIPDPDNAGEFIETMHSTVEATDLQYASLYSTFDVNQHFRIYGIFYHHIKAQNDSTNSTTWQFGLRWFFS